jgi:hypothetical protein
MTMNAMRTIEMMKIDRVQAGVVRMMMATMTARLVAQMIVSRKTMIQINADRVFCEQTMGKTRGVRLRGTRQ